MKFAIEQTAQVGKINLTIGSILLLLSTLVSYVLYCITREDLNITDIFENEKILSNQEKEAEMNNHPHAKYLKNENEEAKADMTPREILNIQSMGTIK